MITEARLQKWIEDYRADVVKNAWKTICEQGTAVKMAIAKGEAKVLEKLEEDIKDLRQDS